MLSALHLRSSGALSSLFALTLLACAPAAAPLGASAGTHGLPGLAVGVCGARVLTRLYFGLSSPEGPISEAAFQAFIGDTVTPRFPDGMTLLVADGQWRGKDGKTEREASRVLELVHEKSDAVDVKLVEIIALYKHRFRQEAVLVVRQDATGCFAAAHAKAALEPG